MEHPELNDEELELDADESDESGKKKPWRDKTRGRSKYKRKALVRLGSMTPEAFAVHDARNMWERCAMALIKRSEAQTAVGNAAYQLIRDTLGEKPHIKEEQSDSGLVVVDDLPRPKRHLQ